MKIEGYLFLPFNCQLRFRFFASPTPLDPLFYKSDGAYDRVFAMVGRPATCVELVALPAVLEQYEVWLSAVITREVMPELRKAERDTVIRKECPRADVTFGKIEHRAYALFTAV